MDPQQAVAYIGNDTVDKNLLALRVCYPLQVYDFQAFVSDHPSFLLYSSGNMDGSGCLAASRGTATHLKSSRRGRATRCIWSPGRETRLDATHGRILDEVAEPCTETIPDWLPRPVAFESATGPHKSSRGR